MAASGHDSDEADVEFYHHSEYSDAYAGDAIFRVLARPASTVAKRTPSWTSALALSHGGWEVVKKRRILWHYAPIAGGLEPRVQCSVYLRLRATSLMVSGRPRAMASGEGVGRGKGQ